MPIKPTKAVNEDSSCRIKFTLTDYDDAVISVQDIVSAIMVVTNKRDGKIIPVDLGGGDGEQSSNEVKAYFDSVGVFSLPIPGSANPVLTTDKSKKIETHIATFTITVTASTTLTLVETYWIRVNNLKAT